jgi:hypothetical protein
MRPGAAFVPFVVVAAVLLAGCSGSTSGSPTDPEPSSGPRSAAPTTSSLSTPATSVTVTSPPASASTAIPADVPTTGPNLLRKGERPPVMPALATHRTRAGGVAFAKFFIETIDWAYATTNTDYKRHYYVSACITCTSIDKAITREARKRRHFVGDRLSVLGVRNVSQVVPDGPELSLIVDIAVGSVRVVDATGRRIDSQPATTIHDFVALYWISGRWTVQQVRPT